MNYLARQEMFNSACAAMQGILECAAGRIIEDNELAGYEQRDVSGMFLEYIGGDLGSVPDSAFASQEMLQRYLLDSLDVYGALLVEERRSPDILEPKDLEDSGFALDAITDERKGASGGQRPRVFHTGPDCHIDTDEVVHLPFGRSRNPIPIDVHAVQKTVESLY